MKGKNRSGPNDVITGGLCLAPEWHHLTQSPGIAWHHHAGTGDPGTSAAWHHHRAAPATEIACFAPQFAPLNISAAARWCIPAFLGRPTFASFFGTVTHPLAAPGLSKAENPYFLWILVPNRVLQMKRGWIWLFNMSSTEFLEISPLVVRSPATRGNISSAPFPL